MQRTRHELRGMLDELAILIALLRATKDRARSLKVLDDPIVWN